LNQNKKQSPKPISTITLPNSKKDSRFHLYLGSREDKYYFGKSPKNDENIPLLLNHCAFLFQNQKAFDNCVLIPEDLVFMEKQIIVFTKFSRYNLSKNPGEFVNNNEIAKNIVQAMYYIHNMELTYTVTEENVVLYEGKAYLAWVGLENSGKKHDDILQLGRILEILIGSNDIIDRMKNPNPYERPKINEVAKHFGLPCDEDEYESY